MSDESKSGGGKAAGGGAEKKNFSFEIYQRPDGWWSFRVNGRESHYRSSNAEGLGRTMKALLFGAGPGKVALKAAKMGAAESPGPPPAEPDWSELPTQEERLEAFFRRGKLGEKG